MEPMGNRLLHPVPSSLLDVKNSPVAIALLTTIVLGILSAERPHFLPHLLRKRRVLAALTVSAGTITGHLFWMRMRRQASQGLPLSSPPLRSPILLRKNSSRGADLEKESQFEELSYEASKELFSSDRIKSLINNIEMVRSLHGGIKQELIISLLIPKKDLNVLSRAAFETFIPFFKEESMLCEILFERIMTGSSFKDEKERLHRLSLLIPYITPGTILFYLKAIPLEYQRQSWDKIAADLRKPALDRTELPLQSIQNLIHAREQFNPDDPQLLHQVSLIISRKIDSALQEKMHEMIPQLTLETLISILEDASHQIEYNASVIEQLFTKLEKKSICLAMNYPSVDSIVQWIEDDEARKIHLPYMLNWWQQVQLRESTRDALSCTQRLAPFLTIQEFYSILTTFNLNESQKCLLKRELIRQFSIDKITPSSLDLDVFSFLFEEVLAFYASSPPPGLDFALEALFKNIQEEKALFVWSYLSCRKMKNSTCRSCLRALAEWQYKCRQADFIKKVFSFMSISLNATFIQELTGVFHRKGSAFFMLQDNWEQLFSITEEEFSSSFFVPFKKYFCADASYPVVNAVWQAVVAFWMGSFGQLYERAAEQHTLRAFMKVWTSIEAQCLDKIHSAKKTGLQTAEQWGVHFYNSVNEVLHDDQIVRCISIFLEKGALNEIELTVFIRCAVEHEQAANFFYCFEQVEHKKAILEAIGNRSRLIATLSISDMQPSLLEQSLLITHFRKIFTGLEQQLKNESNTLKKVNEYEKQGHFVKLPAEIELQLLSLLSPEDLCRFAQASSDCRSRACDDLLWKALVLKKWLLQDEKITQLSWKAIYGTLVELERYFTIIQTSTHHAWTEMIIWSLTKEQYLWMAMFCARDKNTIIPLVNSSNFAMYSPETLIENDSLTLMDYFRKVVEDSSFREEIIRQLLRDDDESSKVALKKIGALACDEQDLKKNNSIFEQIYWMLQKEGQDCLSLYVGMFEYYDGIQQWAGQEQVDMNVCSLSPILLKEMCMCKPLRGIKRLLGSLERQAEMLNKNAIVKLRLLFEIMPYPRKPFFSICSQQTASLLIDRWLLNIQDPNIAVTGLKRMAFSIKVITKYPDFFALFAAKITPEFWSRFFVANDDTMKDRYGLCNLLPSLIPLVAAPDLLKTFGRYYLYRKWGSLNNVVSIMVREKKMSFFLEGFREQSIGPIALPTSQDRYFQFLKLVSETLIDPSEQQLFLALLTSEEQATVYISST